jgi:aspartate racemase
MLIEGIGTRPVGDREESDEGRTRQALQGVLMKTIGVLGGLGPQATMDFEARVHRVSQRLIPPNLNGGYPPMVVYYCRHPPVLVSKEGIAESPLRADPRLFQAAKRLGALCDFLAIPCNSAHLFLEEIEQASGCKVLSMIDATIWEVERRNWKRVGVLTLGEPVVYSRPLEKIGVACQAADAEARTELDRAIFRLIEGRDDETSIAAAQCAVDALRAKKVDGVILGCTEIPLLLRKRADAPDLINPGEILAEAAVRAAILESN